MQETTAHLLYECMFTTRIVLALKNWLGLHDINTDEWLAIPTVKDWWTEVIHKRGDSRKAMALLAMLVSWEIWLERNARESSTATMLIHKIKDEMVMWGRAGAKAFCNIIPR